LFVGNPTWSVAATVDESLAAIAGFSAYYLGLGASCISIYLDRARDDVVAFFADDPQVTIIVTDDAYWAPFGGRPKSHVKRQLFNALEAYNSCDEEWMLHCDCDDFVVVRNRFFRELANVPDRYLAVKVNSFERAWIEGESYDTIYGGIARFPIWSEGGAETLRGAELPFLRQGNASYINCKCFLRTGCDLFPGIHFPTLMKDGWSHEGVHPPLWPSKFSNVLHFDSFTELHWILKLVRKSQQVPSLKALFSRLGPHRRAQVQAVLDAKSYQELSAVHKLVRFIPREQISRLRGLGIVTSINIDPVADAVARYGALDFSDAAHDAEWARMEPDLCDWVLSLKDQKQAT